MKCSILFSKSAFKHGVTEADILKAFGTKKYDAELDEGGFEDKHLLVGFDCNANLLEVMYNPIDNDTVRVFHAMRCRKAYSKLLKTKE